MLTKHIKLLEIIREKPSRLVGISVLFGIFGAFIDALIDFLFFYEEDLWEVFLPPLNSHEFYMRVMLIITLTSFSFLVVFLMKRLNIYDSKLKSINEHLEELVSQRTKEFSDLFSQSPFAKALLSKDFEILETNDAWNNFFNNDNTVLAGANIFSNENFNEEKIKNSIYLVRDEQKYFKSTSIYFDELDKIIMLSVYPITNNSNGIEKIVCQVEDITDKLKRDETDKELETQKINMKTIFDFIENERRRLSEELHDEIGQKLMISKLRLELLKKECGNYDEKIDEVTSLLQSINVEIKKIVYALHPSELINYGLEKAIISRLNHCSKVGGYKSEFNSLGKFKKLPKEVELGIYRICQEALSNITKHAKATFVKIDLNFNENMLYVIIQDNGLGFNSNIKNELKKYGLISMKERTKILNGNLEIESAPGSGTKLLLEIPL